MNIDKKEKALRMSFFLSFLLWLCVTTWRIAPFNPPEWSNGDLYVVWWFMVLWGIMITSMAPVGCVVILSCRLFGLPSALFCSFCFIWFFDYFMTKNYPIFAITPGVTLSALYVFVDLKQKKHIEI